MRAYKMSYSGAPNVLGQSPLQVVATGRVKLVQISLLADVAATKDVYATVSVGTAAVSENGLSTASPSNFAFATIGGVGAAAAPVRAFENVSVPCDFPVTAGQNIVLNFASDSAADISLEQCEIMVWVA